MEREEIAAVVRRHLLDIVPDLQDADLDGTRSMEELGANSLDVVDLVSSAMRELKVKIPVAELGDVTDLEGLVDLLHAAVNER